MTDPARALYDAFDSHQRRFGEITRRVAVNFARRDWSATQRDSAERLSLYRQQVDAAIEAVRLGFGDARGERNVWSDMRERYAALVHERPDRDIARTFFNSVSRRVFTTVGVDAAVEFTAPADDPPAPTGERAAAQHRSYSLADGTLAAVRAIIASIPLGAPFADADGEARRIAAAIDMEVRSAWPAEPPARIELLPNPFYRNKGAYLVGRLCTAEGVTPERVTPLVIALLHGEEGVFADAVLMTSDDVSVIFGFSWSYFHVDTPDPCAVVDFLASVMPLKRTDELYTAIGYNKHGKTELYRALAAHLREPGARFERAEGQRGMVMAVFTLPSFNVVFKVIRDSFAYPKRTTRREVMEKYRWVFVRDRVGRLADAQEFEHLELPRCCFSDEILAELLETAAGSVRIEDDRVVISHLYTERRLTPLDLYLRAGHEGAARDAVWDYGQAIKDLAHAGIFTGDMLLKNFGVSRHGRVIFYDYDELTDLGECRFREMPEGRDPDEEFAAEPWFSLDEHDVFPEELLHFLVPEGPLRAAFLDAHGDLLRAEWWIEVQRRVRDGELYDVFPYGEHRRLSRRAPSDSPMPGRAG